MRKGESRLNRRKFLKTVGAAGLGTIVASGRALGDANEPNLSDPNTSKEQKLEHPELPKRKLGKTGIEVPVMSNGLMFDVMENQVILKANLQYNVTHWDTAHSYAGGNSELAIGKFLKKNPEVRKKLFIVTKASRAKTAEDVEQRLQESLKRMNLEHIDLYYGVHACDTPEQLTDELRKWAEDAKKRELIRYFGFSTHRNMEKCLMAASKLDWIDAIMTSYNISLMQKPEMQEAIEACHQAGIGLIAMKVLRGVQKTRPEEEEKMIGHFLKRGFTDGQAKIKAVLEDKRITTACIRMENITLLKSNVAAVLDKTELTAKDKKVLKQYADATCSGYCAGCADICDLALPAIPYISDIMRYLMYYNSYGDRDEARELFAQIPERVRDELLSVDYSTAENLCPQHMPIGELMAEAVEKLA